jgi:hypothetical protein
LKIDLASAQKFAAYAIKHVYQFTYPRKLDDATPRQKFLLETREKIARRFREDCGSAVPSDMANVYPHFIGVFDTVAALGNPVTTGLFSGAFLLLAAALGLVGKFLSLFSAAPAIGWILSYLVFWHVFVATVAAALILALGVYVFTHFKWDFAVLGYGLKASLKTIHFNDLWMAFYDYNLNPNVGYARHAISIDEDRASFQRVPWYSVKTTARDTAGIQWFEQVWFAGVHADIGGGYSENESRLSDIALDWMIRWANLIPGGLKHDSSVLTRWPHPQGPQHDEVKVGLGLGTDLTGLTWSKQDRRLPSPDAIMHPSVYARFDLRTVPIYDEMRSYRPETLKTHTDFARYYQPGAPFPAQSLQNATAIADDPAVVAVRVQHGDS